MGVAWGQGGGGRVGCRGYDDDCIRLAGGVCGQGGGSSDQGSHRVTHHIKDDSARLSQFMVETHFLGSCVLTITTGLSASEKVKVCGPQDRSSDLGGQFFSL